MHKFATAVSAALTLATLGACSGVEPTVASCNSNSRFSAAQIGRDQAQKFAREGHGDVAAELLRTAFADANSALHDERDRRNIVIKDDSSLNFSLGYGEFVRDKDVAGLNRMIGTVDDQMDRFRKLTGCQ